MEDSAADECPEPLDDTEDGQSDSPTQGYGVVAAFREWVEPVAVILSTLLFLVTVGLWWETRAARLNNEKSIEMTSRSLAIAEAGNRIQERMIQLEEAVRLGSRFDLAWLEHGATVTVVRSGQLVESFEADTWDFIVIDQDRIVPIYYWSPDLMQFSNDQFKEYLSRDGQVVAAFTQNLRPGYGLPSDYHARTELNRVHETCDKLGLQCSVLSYMGIHYRDLLAARGRSARYAT